MRSWCQPGLVWWKCHLAGCAFHYGCVQRQQSLLGGNGDEQKLAQHIYSGVARIWWGILTDTAQQETSRCLFYLHPKDFEARNSTLKSLCSSRGLGFFLGGGFHRLRLAAVMHGVCWDHQNGSVIHHVQNSNMGRSLM